MDTSPANVKQNTWAPQGQEYTGLPFSEGSYNEANVNLTSQFQNKLHRFAIAIQRFAVSHQTLAAIFGYLARRCKIAHIRLEAAPSAISHLSLQVQLDHQDTGDGILYQAALDVKAQSALTAIALKAWDIDMGTRAIDRITNKFSLIRIARSAHQDPIRLKAALKLKSPRLLRQLADTTRDIHVRWQIAKALDDPYLLAQISLFKTTNAHFAPLRAEARQALLNHLDTLVRKNDRAALKAIFFTQPDPSIRLEVLLRISRDDIDAEVMEALSRCNFRHVHKHLIRQILNKINGAGWHVVQDKMRIICSHCSGKGTSAYRSITGQQQHQLKSDMLPCVECSATGYMKQNRITCVREGAKSIVFALPIESYKQTHMVTQ